MSYFSSNVINKKRRETNEEFIDRLEEENNNLLDRLEELIKQYNLKEETAERIKRSKKDTDQMYIFNLDNEHTRCGSRRQIFSFKLKI